MNALSAAEFSSLMEIFAPFEASPTIAVAVSGGPDSMALALLAHKWAAASDGQAVCLTVDHHLRENSTQEAWQVKSWLEAKGITHHILSWEGAKPATGGIQANARRARYTLLGQWCKNHQIRHLLTAHHAQDQWETFMMRLAKGSGLKGLCGIQGEILSDFGRILRPLLAVPPQRLLETLHTFGQPYITDPSNQNSNFTRNRWRKLYPSLAEEGLTAITLKKTLAHLQQAQRLLDQHISQLLKKYVVISPYGYARISREAMGEPREALEEIFKNVLGIIGARAYPVQHQALQRALEKAYSGCAFTIGGCQVLPKARELWVVREFAAIGKDIAVDQTIAHPGHYWWDNRFRVEVKNSESPCRIAALGQGYQQHLQNITVAGIQDIPKIVLKTLPALWGDKNMFLSVPPFIFKYFGY